MAYVYCHLKADSGEPFYVGMGKTKARPLNMVSRSNWHKNIAAKHGVRVEIIVDEIDWDTALWWEIKWIKALKDAGYGLVNLTNGGDGVRGLEFTDQHKKKLAKAKLGCKQSKETIEKRASSLRGRKRPRHVVEKIATANAGQKRTPEQNAQNSGRMKLLMQSQLIRKKLSEANMGRSPSSETRRKLSEANKGKILTAEHKKKIGEANKGKKSALGLKRSEETRIKMSISAKAREETKRLKELSQ